ISTFFKFDYKDHPELEGLTSLNKYERGELRMRVDNQTYFPEGIVTDSVFFRIFDFSLIRGDKDQAVKNPDDIVITEKLASQIFGEKDPMGKNITVMLRQEIEYTVKGILKNPPPNSSLTFDFILPDHPDGNIYSLMGADNILAGENFDFAAFNEKI